MRQKPVNRYWWNKEELRSLLEQGVELTPGTETKLDLSQFSVSLEVEETERLEH